MYKAIPGKESCDEGERLVLLGEKGGSGFLLGSEKFDETYLLNVAEEGIVTGAVPGLTLTILGLLLLPLGEPEGEKGGESWWLWW